MFPPFIRFLFFNLFYFAQDHEPYGHEPDLLFESCQCAERHEKVVLVKRFDCLGRALLDISKHFPRGGYDDLPDGVFVNHSRFLRPQVRPILPPVRAAELIRCVLALHLERLYCKSCTCARQKSDAADLDQ